MSLPAEYFTDQTYLTDLQKLKDEELYRIIRLFRDELKNFNESEEFKLKGLIIACNEMKDLIKDFRFILNSYLKLMRQNDNDVLLDALKDIEDLKSVINKIEIYLDKIKAVRLLKERVDELVEKCLYKMRILYDSLSDFIYEEYVFWKQYSPLE